MSLPPATRPTEGALPRSTRQLLDELDALMDKMLALPVDDEPPQSEPADAPPTVAATLTMIEPDEAKIPIKRVGPRQAREVKLKTARSETDEVDTPAQPWNAGHFDIAPDSAALFVAPVAEEPKPRETAVLDRPSPFVPETSTSFRREPSRPLPKSSASWTIGTLVVWDRGFRRLTRRLGPIGWLLRSGAGRILLGLAGLAFWIVALVWLVRDWMQWTG